MIHTKSYQFSPDYGTISLNQINRVKMSIMNIINKDAWFPPYTHKQEHIYILLTSLNLGGAEKIVSDQLWANYHQKYSHKVTLIVIYDKKKEHSIPPNVNIVRLNNNIQNGESLFRQIAYDNTPLVTHLINDTMAHYLFSLNISLHLVIHNDKKGWSNSPDVFNHPQVISLISICDFVTNQLKEVCDKNVITVRHQINHKQHTFSEQLREKYRTELALTDSDILIGMTGRICYQKNYFLALDVLADLCKNNKNYKLIILGGFEPANQPVYFSLLQKANKLGIQKNLFMPGFKDNAAEWLNAFDIGLNVSHFEGLSMATQEFMMNGLQMVAANVSGQKEITDLHKQLHFFDIPENLNKIETKDYHINLGYADIDNVEEFVQYKHLVSNVSELIKKNHSKRILFTEKQKSDLSYLAYGSHNIWSLFNFLPNKEINHFSKPAFLTCNLNLGGAQRSLVNLLCKMKDENVEIPLIMLNQSNYTGFYQQIIEKEIDYYLCHSHNDVFSIMTNLMKYIFDNDISELILWNVESKIKLLLNKFLGHHVSIVDVSPGDYCLHEMDNEILFQSAIYQNKEQYFSGLYKFVSKFDNSDKNEEYKQYLKNDVVIVPNGVPIENNFIKTKTYKGESFKFLVCGRITQSKHIDLILDSFKKLYADNSDIFIDLYGSVEPYNLDYFHYLQEKYSELIQSGKVNFKGNIDDPRSIMKHYDAIIVLGTHQGSPNVVLEAVSCKLPCISNDSGGTREIIGEKTGILLESMPDIESVYEAMSYTVNHYDTIWERNERAFQKVNQDFSMDLMFNRYMNVIF